MGVCVKLDIESSSSSSSREHFFVKSTYFATLILRKVKEIETNPTTRFQDIELNCGVG